MLMDNYKKLMEAIDFELFRQGRDLTPAMIEKVIDFLKEELKINVDLED
jgi:uncharacterized protein YpuA (DUF1002 family)